VFHPKNLRFFRDGFLQLRRRIRDDAQSCVRAFRRFLLAKRFAPLQLTDGAVMSDQVPAPTTRDYDDLTFWLWAFITDAEAFLHFAAERSRKIRIRSTGFQERAIDALQVRLAQYHLATCMGSMLRQLDRLNQLFPGVQAAYEGAKHLRQEGKELRDFIEHADEYAAGKGRKNKRERYFRRTKKLLPNLPGAAKIDALSMVKNQDGHWIGGRLNVERALAEAKAISIEAQKISRASLPDPPRPTGL
jgi:hypothetical protein